MTAQEEYWQTPETETAAIWLETLFDANPEVKKEIAEIKDNRQREKYLKTELKFFSDLGCKLFELAMYQKTDEIQAVREVDESMDISINCIAYDVLAEHFFPSRD